MSFPHYQALLLISYLRRLMPHFIGIGLERLYRPMARQLHGKVRIHSILN
jgi:hypothetical protein